MSDYYMFVDGIGYCEPDEVLDFDARRELNAEANRPMEFIEACEYYARWCYYDVPIYRRYDGYVRDLLLWCDYQDEDIERMLPVINEMMEEYYQADLLVHPLEYDEIPF